MAEATQLEKYLKREPLNEHLEALAAGKEFEAESTPAIESELITDDDRETLKRMKFEGLPVLLKLLDAELEKCEASAISLSHADPLANRDAIAETWAYVSIQKRMRNLLVELIDSEIEKLRGRT